MTAKQQARIDSLEAKFEKVCVKIEAKEDKLRHLEDAGEEHTSKYETVAEQLFDLENEQYDIQNMIEAIYAEAGVAYA